MTALRQVSLLGLTALALWMPGCATKQSPAPSAPVPTTQPTAPKKFFLFSWMDGLGKIFPKKKNPPAAITPQWAGEIRMVNAAERFVLIESPSSSAAIPGETYIAVGRNTETATLRMTALKNPPFLIADILTGDPSPGEKIYVPRPSSPPTTDPIPAPNPAPNPAASPVPTPKPAVQPKPKPTPSSQPKRRPPSFQR